MVFSNFKLLVVYSWNSCFEVRFSSDLKSCFQSDLFRQGALFHSVLEDFLISGATCKNDHPSPEYPPEVRGYIESISDILEDVSAVRATESTVRHGTLNYLGVVDCVARYR